MIGAGTVSWLLTALPTTVADGLKKLLEAAIAEAATSAVSLSVCTEDVSAACRFAVVAAVSAPIRNEPAGGGFFVVAVNVICSLVPSGRSKLNEILSPSVGIDGAEIDGHCRRRTGRLRHGRAGQRRGDRAELQSERRTVFGETGNGRRQRRRRDGEVRHVADALVGLAAFVDQLLQSRLRPNAIEHDVGRHRRSRVGGAAGKQIAIARLAVEQRHRVGERSLRRDLPGGLTAVVEHDRRRAGRAFDRLADIDHSLQRQVDDVEPRIDVGCGVLESVDAADLGAQAEREAAIGALPGVGRRDPAACKLLGQIIRADSSG